MQRVNLGGDRLGSGAKMDVKFKGYERSTHDLGYIWRSTMSAGTLVPFLVEWGLPGDSWDMDFNIDVKTHPTTGPLFGSAKVQADTFWLPARLYIGLLHNNALNIGRNMENVWLPQMEIEVQDYQDTPDPDNAQVNPSCIFAYLGLRGFGHVTPGQGPIPRYFEALTWMGYWDTVKNYYANKQEEDAWVIHTPFVTPPSNVTTILINGNTVTKYPASSYVPVTAGSQMTINYTGGIGSTPDIYGIAITLVDGTIILAGNMGIKINDTGSTVTIAITTTRPNAIRWDYTNPVSPGLGAIELSNFPLENIDKMRQAATSHMTLGTPWSLNTLNLPPFSYIVGTASRQRSATQSQEGLAVKTYQSDVFNNWVNEDWIADVNAVTAVSVGGGAFNIESLIFAEKLYELLMRVVVSDGTYRAWSETVYDHR